LDAIYVKDSAAKEILSNLQNKIETVMLLHLQLQLQDVDDANSIELGSYIELILDSFFKHNVGKGQKIHIDKEIDSFKLDVEKAIPLRLIINELSANCRKHAFSEQDEGRIFISLKRFDGKLYLTFEDDGKGLPEHIRRGSLGLTLVESLAEQLKGDFSISNNTPRGTVASLSFQC
ncbi:MAG: sensor histidine kinase, partial [Spirochaetales bacterium]|nr:sensor histidine kinase [Spirochaetales bacterium]